MKIFSFFIPIFFRCWIDSSNLLASDFVKLISTIHNFIGQCNWISLPEKKKKKEVIIKNKSEALFLLFLFFSPFCPPLFLFFFVYPLFVPPFGPFLLLFSLFVHSFFCSSLFFVSIETSPNNVFAFFFLIATQRKAANFVLLNDRYSEQRNSLEWHSNQNPVSRQLIFYRRHFNELSYQCCHYQIRLFFVVWLIDFNGISTRFGLIRSWVTA